MNVLQERFVELKKFHENRVKGIQLLKDVYDSINQRRSDGSDAIGASENADVLDEFMDEQISYIVYMYDVMFPEIDVNNGVYALATNAK